jgi:hypothetical protein
MPTHLEPTVRVLVDPGPDDRGNVLAMATTAGGRWIALQINAN